MDIFNRMLPAFLYKSILSFSLAFTLQLLIAQDAVPAAAPEEEDEEDTEMVETVDWRIERDEILKEIKKYVDETVAKTVTRDSTTRFISIMIQRGQEIPKLGNFKNLRGVNMAQWKWPIAKPKATVEEIVNSKTADNIQRVNI